MKKKKFEIGTCLSGMMCNNSLADNEVEDNEVVIPFWFLNMASYYRDLRLHGKHIIFNVEAMVNLGIPVWHFFSLDMWDPSATFMKWYISKTTSILGYPLRLLTSESVILKKNWGRKSGVCLCTIPFYQWTKELYLLPMIQQLFLDHTHIHMHIYIPRRWHQKCERASSPTWCTYVGCYVTKWVPWYNDYSMYFYKKRNIRQHSWPCRRNGEWKETS